MPIENLIIRRAEPDDYLALYEMFKRPELYSATLQLPYPSREYWQKRIGEVPDGLYSLVAVVGERVVGLISVETFPHRPRRKHVGRIGINVDAEWQGKGVGSALMAAAVDLADNWLNLTRLELEVYSDNAAAIHLYERFEFTYEGTMRQHAFRDGQYIDSNMMARLRTSKE